MGIDRETFVHEIRNLAPSASDLSGRNLSEEFTERFINSFRCLKKTEDVKIFTSDELLMLLQTYNCSKIEIGILSFLNRINEHVDYFEIGKAEQDMLTVDKTTMQVRVLDFEKPHHIIWHCASSGANFLQAILSAAEFLTSKIKVYPYVEPDEKTILK